MLDGAPELGQIGDLEDLGRHAPDVDEALEMLDRDAVGIDRRCRAGIAVAHAVEPGRQLRRRHPQRSRQLLLRVDRGMQAVEPRQLVAQMRNVRVAPGIFRVELAFSQFFVVFAVHRLSPKCVHSIRASRRGSQSKSFPRDPRGAN
jgi:hypothetical protein